MNMSLVIICNGNLVGMTGILTLSVVFKNNATFPSGSSNPTSKASSIGTVLVSAVWNCAFWTVTLSLVSNCLSTVIWVFYAGSVTVFWSRSSNCCPTALFIYSLIFCLAEGLAVRLLLLYILCSRCSFHQFRWSASETVLKCLIRLLECQRSPRVEIDSLGLACTVYKTFFSSC